MGCGVSSEWDNTPWGGTAVLTEASNKVWGANPSGTLAKAAIGWQSVYTADRTPIRDLHRSPLRRMRSEQALYWNNPWIMTAEDGVTRRVAGLPWHLEDEDDEEVEDATPNPALKAIRLLLEKPQATLPIAQRQVGIESWTNLISITSRHLGLCGMTHWFLDSIDAQGIPSALLYINPARLFPHIAATGQLLEWILDPKDDYGRGGTALRRDQVLTFYLRPPDGGAIATGYVQAAYLKAQVTHLADSHMGGLLGKGGRLGGIISPKEGTLQDDQYNTLTRELMNIQEAPDSAARLAVIRGPIDIHQTAANPEQLDLAAIASMNRDDILAVWGVPASQVGIPSPSGMNSGETRKYDEAVLMQGAVHDRVRPIRETLQLGLLDRWNAQGLSPQIVIEEPEFDDRTPAFELADKAKDQPLTRNERRAIMGLNPLPEYGPDGAPLGLAIDLNSLIQTVAQGEEDERGSKPGRFTVTSTPTTAVVAPAGPSISREEADAIGVLIRAGFDPTDALRSLGLPPIKHVGLLPITLQSDPIEAAVVDDALATAKAGPLDRAAVIRRFEPAVRKAVASVLSEQRAEVAQKVREKGEHIARKPTDREKWWDAKKWDKRLLEAIKTGLAGVATSVVTKVTAKLGQPAKADPFTQTVLEAILRSVGTRVTGINQTTRDAIAQLIGTGFSDGLAPAQIADLITEATPFDDARAELIARTETALVYNEAALVSFKEYGVDKVEAIDGDEDDECRDRNGQVFSLEEALQIEDHPNGTLDWSPVFA